MQKGTKKNHHAYHMMTLFFLLSHSLFLYYFAVFDTIYPVIGKLF